MTDVGRHASESPGRPASTRPYWATAQREIVLAEIRALRAELEAVSDRIDAVGPHSILLNAYSDRSAVINNRLATLEHRAALYDHGLWRIFLWPRYQEVIGVLCFLVAFPILVFPYINNDLWFIPAPYSGWLVAPMYPLWAIIAVKFSESKPLLITITTTLIVLFAALVAGGWLISRVYTSVATSL